MRKNRGPEARMRETAADMGEVLGRLPRLIAQIDDATRLITTTGLPLDTRGNGRRGVTRTGWLLALAAGIAIGIWMLS